MTQSTNLKAPVLPTNESRDRRSAMLRTAFGPEIAAALADPTVIEVMVNPDGRLWLDRLGQGRAVTGTRLTPEDAERIVRLVASHVGREVRADAPVISAELPGRGDAGGQDPHPDRDYVASGIMTLWQAGVYTGSRQTN